MSSTQLAEINALFADIDNDDFFKNDDNLDLEAIRRNAATEHAKKLHKTLSSASSTSHDANTITKPATEAEPKRTEDKKDGEPKPRAKLPKLDEASLLGANGLPQLIADTKHFKPRGKGHEVRPRFVMYAFID
jgi:replication fork protection complex subunit Csm3/Swi3